MVALTWEPLIPLALWVLLAVTGAAALMWYGRRRIALSRRRWAFALTLQGVGLLLVLAVLLNPTWIEPVAPPGGRPFVSLYVDASGSMATADDSGGRTRYAGASELAEAFARELAGQSELRAFTFAATATPTTPDALNRVIPNGESTDLANVLSAAIQDSRQQGQPLLLLSDGIPSVPGGTDRVLDIARLARALSCPIHTRTFGRDTALNDVTIELRSPQELAFVDQPVKVPVRIKHRGFGGQRVTLVVRQGTTEIERREVSLPVGNAAELQVAVGKPKAGLYRYELRVEPLPGEATTANNSTTLLLRVVDKPVRVLLLEGKPYWDGKFLARTILSEPSLELDEVVRLGPTRFLRRLTRRVPLAGSSEPPPDEWGVLPDASAALPDAEGLKAYHAVLLGRDADAFLTDDVLARLKTWIGRDGGAVVCVRGQPAAQVGQRLSQLLPLDWQPGSESRVQLSSTGPGREARWLPAESANDLPTLATAARPGRLKPLAVVLATARDAGGAEVPAVTYQAYGTGRVVVIEGAGMWRWAFLPPQQKGADDAYRTLWLGLLRWLTAGSELAPGQKTSLRGDKVRFRVGEPATATLLVREEGAPGGPPMIELRGDADGPVRSLKPSAAGDEPGVYRVAFGNLPEGRYEAAVAGAAADDPGARTAFDVYRADEEQMDLSARPDLMGRIAAESGGATLDGLTPAEAVRKFQSHRAQAGPTTVVRSPAWDRAWVLLLAFGVWTTAWMVRRRGGLV